MQYAVYLDCDWNNGKNLADKINEWLAEHGHLYRIEKIEYASALHGMDSYGISRGLDSCILLCVPHEVENPLRDKPNHV